MRAVSEPSRPATPDNQVFQPPPVGYLSTHEAARFLSVSAKDLERMRREGRGPRFAKLSRKMVRYSIDDLRAWVALHFVNNTAEGRALHRPEGRAA